MDSIPTYTREEIDAQTDWGARMVSRQFSALEARLRTDILIEELCNVTVRSRIISDEDVTTVASYLRNGWSTEALLKGNRAVFKGRGLAYALHWALAQAYYSVYAVTRALFAVRGVTERTHATVIRRVGADMASGRYPRTMSFLATGGINEISFMNLDPRSVTSTLYLDCDDPNSVDTQIGQFLRATRKRNLKSKKLDMKLKTKRGTPRRSFWREDWEQASQKLGYTSLLSLLYRNRIRANYGEIDTFLSPELETQDVFSALVHIVGCFNLVHEGILHTVVGNVRFESLLRSAGALSHDFVQARASVLRAL